MKEFPNPPVLPQVLESFYDGMRYYSYSTIKLKELGQDEKTLFKTVTSPVMFFNGYQNTNKNNNNNKINPYLSISSSFHTF